jgi:shikimate dehydrogenase
MAADTLERYAVFGNPISHSKSPTIHQLFAKQTGERIQYTAELSTDEDFMEDVLAFFLTGGLGCNVTVPFKEQAWQLADSRTPYAERAKAVNTLKVQTDGTLLGANTDGIGLVRDLQQNQQIDLTNKRILLLGAGGAVRGVIQPLLEAKPASLFIANRTADKARSLAQDFADLGNIQGGGFNDIQGQYDVIINGTSASLQNDLPPLPDNCLAENGVTYDMMYSVNPTAFVKWGQAHQAVKALDGLGMLVEQAAEAYYLWRNIRPSTEIVMRELRP